MIVKDNGRNRAGRYIYRITDKSESHGAHTAISYNNGRHAMDKGETGTWSVHCLKPWTNEKFSTFKEASELFEELTGKTLPPPAWRELTQ